MSSHPQIVPYLVVRNGLQAIKFYEDAFDADVELVLTGDDGKLVVHAALDIDGCGFYLCDEADVDEAAAMSPETLGKTSVVIHLVRRKPRHVDAIMAQAVAHGGQIVIAAHDAPWGDRYGQIRDPFGHIWSFGSHIKSNKEHAHSDA
jgi:PhnB protein